MTLRLGRLPRTFDPRIPHASALLSMKRALAPVPPKVDWSDPLPTDVGMMLNNALGDCTQAGCEHLQMLWTRYADGVAFVQPDPVIETLYERDAGYNPADPSTDRGCVEQTVLNNWLKLGRPGPNGMPNFPLCYVEIDVRNHEDVMRAIYECGGVYIGLVIPQGFMEAMPQTWDKNPNYGAAEGGHCVVAPGYDAAAGTLNIMSWGRKDYRMTWAFWDTYVDEAYALVDRDFIDATGLSPLGQTLFELEQQAQALKWA